MKWLDKDNCIVECDEYELHDMIESRHFAFEGTPILSIS